MIFDIETNAKKPEQVSRVWCICMLDPDSGQQWQFPAAQAPQALGMLSRAPKLIGHNIGSYDLAVLARLYGFEYRGEIINTLILSRLLFNGLSDEPDRYGQHGLEAWGKRLGCHKGEWSKFDTWDPAMMDYCLQDCRVVQRLLEHFREQDPSPAACRLELQYDAFLRRISKHGFTLDVPSTEKLKAKLQRRTERLQRYLDGYFPPQEITNGRPEWYTLEPREAGLLERAMDIPKFATKTAMETWRKAHKLKPRDVQVLEGSPQTKIKRFNANSPKQVISGLRSQGWDPVRSNGSGSISTSESVLWNSGLEAGRLIAAYRGYSKLLSFADQWLKHERDGKLYPSFLSNYAATGRSSCRSPNIQQIPSAKQRKSGMRLLVPYGQRCRSLFKPQDGYPLIGADLAGIEVRLLGHRLAPYDEGSFAELVVSGADIHQRNAEAIGIERDTAKTVLYGSLYGQGSTSLAAALDIPIDEAKAIIQGFTHGTEGFADMKRDLLQELRDTGRIELIDRRKIQVSSDHKALNYAIQGDAAILMKRWAMESAKRLEDTSYRLLAVVHDELQAECLPMDVQAARSVLEASATDVGQELGFRVPVAAKSTHGFDWSQTH